MSDKILSDPVYNWLVTEDTVPRYVWIALVILVLL